MENLLEQLNDAINGYKSAKQRQMCIEHNGKSNDDYHFIGVSFEEL